MSAFSTPPRSSSPDGLAPHRYADGGGTDYERRLLASARLDDAPEASETRWAAVLGGIRTAESDPSVSVSHGQSGLAAAARGWAPWAGGIVGVGLLGAVVASQWHAPAPSLEVPPAARLAEVPDVRDVRRDIEPVPGSSAAAPLPALAASTAEAPVVSRAQGAPERSVRTPSRATPSSVVRSSDLAAEVRAIESIQSLLGWGQPRQAAQALARYRRSFPRGELALEAELLDVDITLASGDRARASEKARVLLDRPGASRYRARLETLLESGTTKRGAGGSNGQALPMNGRR